MNSHDLDLRALSLDIDLSVHEDDEQDPELQIYYRYIMLSILQIHRIESLFQLHLKLTNNRILYRSVGDLSSSLSLFTSQVINNLAVVDAVTETCVLLSGTERGGR